jgi:hypothetical protein
MFKNLFGVYDENEPAFLFVDPDSYFWRDL